jgi:hypothetical protein
MGRDGCMGSPDFRIETRFDILAWHLYVCAMAILMLRIRRESAFKLAKLNVLYVWICLLVSFLKSLPITDVCGAHNFPSGHAVFHVGISMCLLRMRRADVFVWTFSWGFAALSVPVLFLTSIGAYHSPSQMLCGACLGIFMAAVFEFMHTSDWPFWLGMILAWIFYFTNIMALSWSGEWALLVLTSMVLCALAWKTYIHK